MTGTVTSSSPPAMARFPRCSTGPASVYIKLCSRICRHVDPQIRITPAASRAAGGCLSDTSCGLIVGPCGPLVGNPLPVVGELQGDAEVLLLEHRDDRLQVVLLLGGDAELIALDLRLDALRA